MAMKAIAMKGRLKGKKLTGILWAGTGKSWRKKENYFQLEDDRQLRAVLSGESGTFEITCKGATCEVKLLQPKGRVLGTVVLALPRGKL